MDTTHAQHTPKSSSPTQQCVENKKQKNMNKGLKMVKKNVKESDKVLMRMSQIKREKYEKGEDCKVSCWPIGHVA